MFRVGRWFSAVGLGVGEPSLTAPQLVASHKAYLAKIADLANRVADLPADTPENQVTYMRHKLAKLRAYGLEWNFISQTTECVRAARTLVPWIGRSFTFSTLSLVCGGLICCVYLPNQSHVASTRSRALTFSFRAE